MNEKNKYKLRISLEGMKKCFPCSEKLALTFIFSRLQYLIQITVDAVIHVIGKNADHGVPQSVTLITNFGTFPSLYIILIPSC